MAEICTVRIAFNSPRMERLERCVGYMRRALGKRARALLHNVQQHIIQ